MFAHLPNDYHTWRRDDFRRRDDLWRRDDLRRRDNPSQRPDGQAGRLPEPERGSLVALRAEHERSRQLRWARLDPCWQRRVAAQPRGAVGQMTPQGCSQGYWAFLSLLSTTSDRRHPITVPSWLYANERSPFDLLPDPRARLTSIREDGIRW